MLQLEVGRKPVVGIFGASISAALNLILPGSKFGIITTGDFWIDQLSEGVRRYMSTGEDTPETFGGVLATGINFDDMCNKSRTIAQAKVIQTTRQLVRGGGISVICPGGALLIGMEDWIRDACALELGTEKGQNIVVINQIFAGVTTLHGLL